MKIKILWLGMLFLIGCSAAVPPQRFGSPEGALAALEDAVASRGREDARELFGSAGDYLLESGDPNLDKLRADRFVTLFQERHELSPRGDNSFVVSIGAKSWPFPVPLVKEGDTWAFDAAAGKEEILDRRIGENEFAALDVARTIYLAQRQYAARDWNEDGKHTYAERIVSQPGQRDGLYWPTDEIESEESPLGPAIARAGKEGGVLSPTEEPQPYRGYLHRLLKREAQEGERIDALSAPGRYWLISTPTVWSESGVMTFASNERGWIFEKNLGANVRYKELQNLVVDSSWSRVE
ncbi:MAG: hypothetical protein RL417_683 [Pseudomonadota bacterium]|jgi:hypothetical protein